MTTKDMYDVIASDPLDVFVKGTAALYSLDHLDPSSGTSTPAASSRSTFRFTKPI